LKKFITSRRIFCLASRDDLIEFAEGEQASSDSLDPLRVCLIGYNVIVALPEKSNV
jgi:hypothetical protein